MDEWAVKPGQVFAEKAIKFRKSIGADSHPVISRDKHPQQWRDWYAYYGFRRLHASQAMMREKPEKTVPTLSPFDFDLDFNPAHPSPDVPMDRDAGRTPTSEEKFRHARRYPELNPGILFNADAA